MPGGLTGEGAAQVSSRAASSGPDRRASSAIYTGRLKVTLPARAHAPTPQQRVSLTRRHRPARLAARADFLAARLARFSARYPFPPASAAAASSSATPAIAANT